VLNLVRLTISDTQELQPAWSPDNSRIAYVSNQDGNYEIYLMNADGTNLQRLTDYSGWMSNLLGQNMAVVSYSFRRDGFVVYTA
jgi:TolB protein